MPRTTLDLDATILRALKARQRQEKKALGALVSELLAPVLAGDASPRPEPPLAWTAKAMGAKVDLDDKDALLAALDER